MSSWHVHWIMGTSNRPWKLQEYQVYLKLFDLRENIPRGFQIIAIASNKKVLLGYIVFILLHMHPNNSGNLNIISF